MSTRIAALMDVRNFHEVFAVSAVTGKGIPALAERLLQTLGGKDVFVVGCANVGKSTLVQRLAGVIASAAYLKGKRGTSRRELCNDLAVTGSHLPGTTLQAVRIPCFPSDLHALWDTPGIINRKAVQYSLFPVHIMEPMARPDPIPLPSRDAGTEGQWRPGYSILIEAAWMDDLDGDSSAEQAVRDILNGGSNKNNETESTGEKKDTNEGVAENNVENEPLVQNIAAAEEDQEKEEEGDDDEQKDDGKDDQNNEEDEDDDDDEDDDESNQEREEDDEDDSDESDKQSDDDDDDSDEDDMKMKRRKAALEKRRKVIAAAKERRKLRLEQESAKKKEKIVERKPPKNHSGPCVLGRIDLISVDSGYSIFAQAYLHPSLRLRIVPTSEAPEHATVPTKYLSVIRKRMQEAAGQKNAVATKLKEEYSIPLKPFIVPPQNGEFKPSPKEFNENYQTYYMDVVFASLGWISLSHRHSFTLKPYCIDGSVYSKRPALYPTNLASSMEKNEVEDDPFYGMTEEEIHNRLRQAARMGRHSGGGVSPASYSPGRKGSSYGDLNDYSFSNEEGEEDSMWY